MYKHITHHISCVIQILVRFSFRIQTVHMHDKINSIWSVRTNGISAAIANVLWIAFASFTFMNSSTGIVIILQYMTYLKPFSSLRMPIFEIGTLKAITKFYRSNHPTQFMNAVIDDSTIQALWWKQSCRAQPNENNVILELIILHKSAAKMSFSFSTANQLDGLYDFFAEKKMTFNNMK